MSSFHDFDKLREQTEQGRLNLLRSDLELLHTLAAVVNSELKLNSPQHAVETLARANKGYADVCRIFEGRHLWGAASINEIKEKLAALRQELDRLQKLMQSSHPDL